MTDPTAQANEPHQPATLDPEEVRRFAALADEWWNIDGPFKPLHRINPVRLEYIRDRICRNFRRDPAGSRPLHGLQILDIGCGGGLVCEPLCRLGAGMTGIDPAAETIGVAKAHAAANDLAIDYEATTAEALAEAGRNFDCVLALEVVEHIEDVPAFLATAASLVKPGGLLIASTVNRTLKAYALAIVAAEYVLRWVPAGTHQWDRFVTPDEMNLAFRRARLVPQDVRGLVYDPLADEWHLSRDSGVNYFAVARKPA